MSISSSKVSRDSRRLSLKKMKFTNYDLSYKVRERVYEMLISFDNNLNYEFEETQIRKALVALLGESQHEVSYVTKNVFRYDHNADGIISYEEFTNFCLQQHFGEMAIQRLHKKGIYSKGRERIMNQDEFNKTLLYCLSFIKLNPDLSQLRQIFQDIDINRKGNITYSEYFTFLKEYFGSLSKSAEAIQIETVNEALRKKKSANEESQNEIQQRKRKQEEQQRNREQQQRQREEHQRKREEQQRNRDEQYRKREEQQRKREEQQRNREEQRKKKEYEERQKRQKEFLQARKRQQQEKVRLQQEKNQRQKLKLTTEKHKNPEVSDEEINISRRIARLVYHQLKIIAMNYDINQTLSINEIVGRQLIMKHFQLEIQDCNTILKELQLANIKITYEKFLEYVVEVLMCRVVPNKIDFPLTREQFVDEMKKWLSYVKAVPSSFMLQDAYNMNRKDEKIDRNAFISLMEKIFGQYQWPRKTGEPRKHSYSFIGTLQLRKKH